MPAGMAVGRRSGCDNAPMPDSPAPEPPATGTSARPVPPAAGHPPAAAAAFDFDGTLTRGGSVWPFLVHVCGLRRVAVAALPLLPRFALAGLLGGTHADTAKEALFLRTLAGRPAALVERRAAAFGTAHFGRRVRPEVRARLERHRAAGHPVAIVSASPELYLRPVAAALGADALIATRLAVDESGRLTGHYDGGNCRGPAKLRRVREWVVGLQSPGDAGAAAGGRAPGSDARTELWAYGNSAGDRELLAGADVGVNVGMLGRVGRLRAFPSMRRVAGLPPGTPAGRPPTGPAGPTGRPGP